MSSLMINDDKLYFNWDKKHKFSYYESTRIKFDQLFNILHNCSPTELALTRPDIVTSAGLNTIYKNFIHGLMGCSLDCFDARTSLVPTNTNKKWWWDDSLQEAKVRSLKLFNLWVSEGSIPNSQSFLNFRNAKNAFKNLVRSKKNKSKSSLSNTLFNYLKNSRGHKFWHLWRTAFKSHGDSRKFKFEGAKNESDVANLLAYAHQTNCSPNSESINIQFKNDYLAKKYSYRSAERFFPVTVSVEMVEKAIFKIKENSAPGHDNIYIEHLRFAHPSVISILKDLFNLFLFLGEVPSDFYKGLVTPIPKFKSHKVNVNAEDFRGITLNVICSKVFEHCLLPHLDCLLTSERQFGFKKGLSCNHIFNLIRNTINHFSSKGNTVNLGFIDVRKAFDKVNIWGMLLNLQKNRVNPMIIEILENWLLNGNARIKWDNYLSDTVPLAAGVRQGGILSPILFSSYINSVLLSLENSKRGCFIGGQCVNSFLYADDLILLTISVTDLQLLVNICNDNFKSLDLQINATKSSCLRIGNRFLGGCSPIRLNENELCWVNEAKYLGISLKAGRTFLCNWHAARRKFYGTLNSILSALGNNPPINVVISLFQSFCVPVLTYGLASFPLSNSELRSLAFVYNSIFHKIFKSNDTEVIEQCQYFCHVLPFWAYYDFIRFSFLAKCVRSGVSHNYYRLSHEDIQETDRLCTKYCISVLDSVPVLKFKFWKFVDGQGCYAN